MAAFRLKQNLFFNKNIAILSVNVKLNKICFSSCQKTTNFQCNSALNIDQI